MSNKQTTHIGIVTDTRSKNRTRLMQIRETPKFWTNGEAWWYKYSKKAPRNKSVYKKKRGSRFSYALVLELDSIRPLTKEEERSFLQAEVDKATKQVERLENQLLDLAFSLPQANKRKNEALMALSKFDDENA